MPDDRLAKQINFILEIDRLKDVIRRSYLVGADRRENSAEHSWHLAMMAVLLAEHAREPVQLARVVEMVLLHDIVEIDAGDTYVYDPKGSEDKAVREQKAADRLFNMLPPDQAVRLMELWHEFEAMATPEAQFAATLDRLMPLLHNVHTKGRSWQEHGVVSSQVHERNRPGRPGSETLWAYGESLIDEAVKRGYLAE